MVRDDDARPDVLDEMQEEIWDAPLQGRNFDMDNFQVYQILKQWTASGVAETHVNRFEETSDGRGAYQLLMQTYEGEDSCQTAITQVRHDIQTAHYTNDTTNFTFDNYCTKHQKANNALEH